MPHQPCKRVDNNLEGTRYIFTLPLKDGGEEKVTLQPKGSATHWYQEVGWFKKRIHEIGSEGCWSSTDSDPKGFMDNVNAGGFVLCDSGKGINGHQIILKKIICISEPCSVPMEITRKERVDDGGW